MTTVIRSQFIADHGNTDYVTALHVYLTLNNLCNLADNKKES